MKSAGQHQCALMVMWAADPRSPVNPNGNGYDLKLSTKSNLPVVFCPFCGELIAKEKVVDESPKTGCEHLRNFVTMPDPSISYDNANDVYSAVGDEQMSIRLFFCPICGDELPSQKRDQPNIEISAKEKSELMKQFIGIETVQELIEKYGPPDYERPASEDFLYPGGKKVSIMIPKTLYYDHLSKSIEVVVLELRDGMIDVKLKPKEFLR